MKPIICSNDSVIILEKIKGFLDENGIMKDLCLLEQNDEQVVFLLSSEKINKDKADIWWSGYSAGLQVALE